MKKSTKSKLLFTILPAATGLVVPAALLSAGCEDPKLKEELKKKQEELNTKQAELESKNKEIQEKDKLISQKDKVIEKIKQTKEIKDILKQLDYYTSPENDNKIEIEEKSVSFKNYNDEYTIAEKNVKAYNIKNQTEVTYVDVDEFLKALDGYIDNSKITSAIDETRNRKVYYCYGSGSPDRLEINWEKNTIHTPNTIFFSSILKFPEQTDDDQFLKNEHEQKREDDEGVLFDLNKYEFDILYKDGKVLLPYIIFNTLFMSQNYTNLYYNGVTFTNIVDGMDSFGKTEDEARKRIREVATLNGKQPTAKEREVNYNHLLFTMDYFYGLKYHKKIKSFEEYIGEDEKAKLLSTDPQVYNKAYINLFHKKLNGLHTIMDSFSYYESNPNEVLRDKLKSPDDYGEYRDRFYKNREMLTKKFETKFGKKISDFGADDYIRFHGNTAFVTLLRFEYGTKDQIKGPDAWKHDTYFLMRHLMNQLRAKPEIKNIVLDLSINNGNGFISMVKTLGFMTDKPILDREYDVLNRTGSLTKWQIDTDGDGKYENDAYENYNWHLLVSLNTFNSANQITSIVKEMGIAKIIGKTTGGGGVYYTNTIVLVDGTTITISSPNNAVFGPKNESIVDGVSPDVELEYDKFYDYDAIDKIIKG
ncbi:S41 family peptidase [Mycoplasma enhydrae]|uniref:S41 family peptidase n=1 Tax=Mycoplasma enhydrae TaxID=2499220 RepID=UPI0021E78CE5|nr:S41 family peptidase [Mycoplasma enhydrae]MCV3733749.1 S41 family peptidase [Mycoplasma enhydrae]